MKRNVLSRAIKQITRTGLASALALGGFAASGADYFTTLTNLNPVGYWRLNEPTQPVVPAYPMTNKSAAGAALNGLYRGVPSLGQPGALTTDTAAGFNGNGQYAEVPYSAALNPSGAFTVEFWAYPTNASSGAKAGVVSRYIPVAGAGGPTGQRGYLFFANNGNTKWQFRVYDGAAGKTITAFDAPDVAADTWQHVVGVFDGSAISIYINGTLGNLTNLVCNYVANTNTPLRIGAGTTETAPSLYFPGTIDEVAVYPTALTAAQIAAHYDAATTNAAGYATQIAANNPAGYWRLNEPVLPPYVPFAATNVGSLGSAFDGTYSTSGSTSGVAGPVRGQFAGFASDNKAMALNGSSGQVTTPGLDWNTDTMTFAGWIKPTAYNFAGLLFNRGSSANGMHMESDGTLRYHWNDGQYGWNSNLKLPIGQWTFAALVVTPTNAVMYMGSSTGLTTATNNVTHLVTAGDGTFYIGSDRPGRVLNGVIDEASVFYQALDRSQISNLFYSATPAIPLVTRTPVDPLYEGMTVSFAAYGVGSTPLTYQWRKGGINISGKTASTLVLTNVTTASSGNYDVVVTGSSLSVTSAVSAITVVAGPPIIVQQPASATRYQGAAVTFAVTIQGSVPWSFQWKKGATAIAGATNAAYTIPSILAADAGSYTVTITNPLGSTNSAAATLTVLQADKYASQVVYTGARAYWQMDEKTGTTAYDYAGNYNCPIVGPVTNNVTSVVPPTYAGYSATNTCFALSGDSLGYLSTPTVLNFTNTSITMAAWVMPYAGMLGITSDVNFVANVGSVGLNSAGTDGTIRAHPLWWIDTGLTFNFDTWNFIVVIWTPTGQTFYLDNGDGAGLRNKTIGGTVDPATWQGRNFFIGRQADRTDRGWPGQIDELALFDRALTASEVQNLHTTAMSGPTAPSIVTQPVSQTVLAGQTASFNVGVVGALPISYQWKYAGANIPGATASTFTIPSPYYTDAGNYTVVAANGIGTPATSDSATLTVQPPETFAYLTNDLVLHLRFDGDYADTSGRANDASAPSSPPTFLSGKIGQGVHIASSKTADNQYLQVSDAAGDLGFDETTSFSVGFWLKYTAPFNDVPIIGNALNSTWNFGWVFTDSATAGKIEYSLVSGINAIQDPVPGCPTINNGAWHHVLGVVDRTNKFASVYVDGAFAGSWSVDGLGSLVSVYSLTIGQDPTGIYGSATFDMDDLGIWRRALTPGDASGIYAAGQIGQSFDVKGPLWVTIKNPGGKVELIWQTGTLQWVNKLGDTWQNVAGAVAPYYTVAPSEAKKFYRVKF